MPNLASVIKAEIQRLARKEAKALAAPLRKDTARLKREVAALKRVAAALIKEARRQRAQESLLRERLVPAPQEEPVRSARFRADSIVRLRNKLRLTQEQLAQLLGVHKNSVSFWEQGRAKPRGKTRAALVALRGIGAREARRRLAAMGGAK